MTPTIPVGEFGLMIYKLVMEEHNGFVNYHAHLDKAGILDPKYLEHCGVAPLQLSDASLPSKQDAMGIFHNRLAYQNQDDLRKRMECYLKQMMKAGVQKIVSFIDVSPDVGLMPIQTAAQLREEYKEKIVFNIATQPIFGFKNDSRFKKSRMEVFEEACKIADIVGGLPERDGREDGIGFSEHMKFVMQCACKLQKSLHIHVDQDNDPSQQHTLDIVRALPYMELPESKNGEPRIWFVHVTSPSAYSEEKFGELLLEIKKCNAGIICCPSATLSTFQNRAIKAPQHSCIARILEMAYLGIPIRLGTDNISDFLVPSSPGDMLYETLFLATVLRFFNPVVLAKFAAGVVLNNFDRDEIGEHLARNLKRYREEDPDFKFCISLS